MKIQSNNQTTVSFCTKCGNESSLNDKFCSKCGNLIFKSSIQQPNYPTVTIRNKTTRALDTISTIWLVLAGIVLFPAVFAILILLFEPSTEKFIYAIIFACSSFQLFAAGILFDAINDIYKATVYK